MQVRDLTTTYKGLIAISDVSLDVAPGEIVCVAGANGAGKSTLLKSIAGLARCAIWHDCLLRREDRGPRSAPHHRAGDRLRS